MKTETKSFPLAYDKVENKKLKWKAFTLFNSLHFYYAESFFV